MKKIKAIDKIQVAMWICVLVLIFEPIIMEIGLKIAESNSPVIFCSRTRGCFYDVPSGVYDIAIWSTILTLIPAFLGIIALMLKANDHKAKEKEKKTVDELPYHDSP